MLAATCLAVDFTISPSANSEIDRIRQIWDDEFIDKADVSVIGWGTTRLYSGFRSSGVVVSFYGESERYRIYDAIQFASNREIVFFITAEIYARFDGRTVDFSEDRGFLPGSKTGSVTRPDALRPV